MDIKTEGVSLAAWEPLPILYYYTNEDRYLLTRLY